MVIGFTDLPFLGERGVKLDSSLTSRTKISSRWIRDVHVKHEITDILEEHMDAYFYNLRRGKTFKNRTPNPEIIQEKMDKIDYKKMSVFLYSQLQSLKNKS